MPDPTSQTLPHVQTLSGWPEVEGIARLAGLRDPSRTRLLVATRYDAWAAVAARVRVLFEHDAPAGRAVATSDGGRVASTARTVSALDTDGARLDVEVVRVGEVLPCAVGETAEPLHDPKGVLEQWVRWSRGRPKPERSAVDAAAELLELDDALRSIETLPPGAGPVGAPRSVRHATTHLLHRRADAMQHYGAEAFRERLTSATADVPPPAEAVREDAGGEAGWERFLGLADREGFRGDRVLFEAVTARLAELTDSQPTFAIGFCLPTFDQVEGRWDLDRTVDLGGHTFRAGVWFGVGVTPADALEFWAAPCLTPVDGGVEWIADDGERPALLRTAGRDAFTDLLRDAVDRAHARASAFEDAAASAFETEAADVDAAARSLSLARSAAGAIRRFLPTIGAGESATAGHIALALSRAATEADPLVARLYARAAGRLAARAP